jgi:hypothetical protein
MAAQKVSNKNQNVLTSYRRKEVLATVPCNTQPPVNWILSLL